MRWRIVIAVATSIVLLTIAALAAMSWTARKPRMLGLRDGRLAPCPDSPNCVSTQAEREHQRLESIPLTINSETALERLKTVVSEMPRAHIVAADDRYLHVEFTSFLFRFVDDVEFFIDGDNHVIHFRSGSRAGYSDFGVNRKRMQAIVAAFQRETSRHERGPKTDR